MQFLAGRIAGFGFAGLLLLCGVTAKALNILANHGFENCVAEESAKPIDGWNWFGKNWNTVVPSEATQARQGTRFFKIFGAFTSNFNTSGIYQNLPCEPGATFNASAWFCSLSSDGGGIHGSGEAWIEVTFRDNLGRVLQMHRSDIVTGSNIGSLGGLDKWFNLRVNSAWTFSNPLDPIGVRATNYATLLRAPARTVSVRYQLMFRQGLDNANGSAFFDDCVMDQLTGTPRAWNVVWSDEFNGSAIDTGKWKFEFGNGTDGWGNKELEYYTNWKENAYVSNGVLHIVARRTNWAGFRYTSARMKTQGLFQKTYGRVEFRGALPTGWGYWPAFWLLGANFPSVGWPACGEVDVMENRGSNLSQVQSTVHYADAQGNHVQPSQLYFYNFDTPDGATGMHSYSLEWTTNLMRWYVDGCLYQTQTNWSTSYAPYPAPFNSPMFLIMNLAVGGLYISNPAPTPATIEASTTFPGVLRVDYVRVLDITPPLQLSVTNLNGAAALTWPGDIACRLQVKTNSVTAPVPWLDVPAQRNPFPIPGSASGKPLFYRLQSP